LIVKQASIAGKVKGVARLFVSSNLMQLATVALVASSGLALHQQAQLSNAKEQIQNAQVQIADILDADGLSVSPENLISTELIEDGSITPDKLDTEFLSKIQAALASLEDPLTSSTDNQTTNSLNLWALQELSLEKNNGSYLIDNSLKNIKSLKINNNSNSLSSDGALLYLNYTGLSLGGEIFRVDDESYDLTPFVIDEFGNVGIGTSNPTAALQIGAGSNILAPLKFSTGSLLSVPQDGAFEFDGTGLYFTANGERFLLNNQPIKETLSLDFPTTSAGYSDIAVNVNGAQPGDTVSIVSPYYSSVGGVYVGWVTAQNTVILRYETNGTYNPPLGSYTVVVSK
jgi:hypothetical protein